jgi:hypothetical protein
VAQLEAGIAKQVRMPGISYRVEQALSRCMWFGEVAVSRDKTSLNITDDVEYGNA